MQQESAGEEPLGGGSGASTQEMFKAGPQGGFLGQAPKGGYQIACQLKKGHLQLRREEGQSVVMRHEQIDEIGELVFQRGMQEQQQGRFPIGFGGMSAKPHQGPDVRDRQASFPQHLVPQAGQKTSGGGIFP